MRARPVLLAGAVLLGGLVALVLWLRWAPLDPVEVGTQVAALPAAGPGSGAVSRAVPGRPGGPVPAAPVPVPPATPARSPASSVASGEAAPVPGPGPVAGERSGLALFPAPGTKPVRRGIIVPEGFELPPGYVRHYQTTDDGVRLPAILMFHPDVAPTDASGQPIPVTPDRIVPPEHAPAGLSVEYLVPPGPEESAR